MVKISNPPTVHDQSHAHDGADGSGTVGHGDVTGVSANQHHTPAALSAVLPGNSLLGVLGTAGVAATVSRGDHAHTLTSPAAPTVQDFGDVAATGVVQKAAREDHLHGMMAQPVRAQIATGSYTGDGATSQAITGVGFRPTFLIVSARITADQFVSAGAGVKSWYFTTDVIMDDNAAGMALGAQGSWQWEINHVIALGSDGFTVDDDGTNEHPNTSSTTYNFVAIG